MEKINFPDPLSTQLKVDMTASAVNDLIEEVNQDKLDNHAQHDILANLIDQAAQRLDKLEVKRERTDKRVSA